MKRTPALLALVAALAVAGTSTANAATVTIGISALGTGSPGGPLSSFSLAHPTGYSWPTNNGCTYSEPNNSATDTGTIYPSGNPFDTSYDLQWGAGYTLSLAVTCPGMAHTVADKDAVTRYGKVTVPGGYTVSRTTGPYNYLGSCNWGGDGYRGMFSTCLFGHATASYRLVLPLGRTYTGMTHTVYNGITACRNTGWVTSHSGRAYTTTFHHGSAAGWSQCDIRSSTLHYKWTAYVTTYTTVYVTGVGAWSAP